MAYPEAVKIKQIRKMILGNLNILYPTAMRLDSLFRTLIGIDPTYDDSLFAKDITYLQEKGYLEFVDDKIGGAGEFKKKVTKLTPEGKEIAERTQTDPALEI